MSGPEHPAHPAGAARTGRRHGFVLGAAALVVLLVLTLCLCLLAFWVRDGSDPMGTPPGSTPTAGSTSPGSVPPGIGEYQDYVDRCLRPTSALSAANVVFDPDMRMTRGSSSTVRAVVTLDTDLPAERVLPGVAATSEPLRVACELEGILTHDEEEFDVRPAGWQPRSLVAGQDAEWSWVVRPKRTGTMSLVMELRPVVLVSVAAGATRRQNLTTASFESTVRVRSDRPVDDWLGRTTDTVSKAGALAQALAGLATAAVLLASALGLSRLWRWLRRRHRRRDPSPPDPGRHDPPPAARAGGEAPPPA